MAHHITLISGDGIGPEVALATRRCVDATGVKIQWDEVEAGVDYLARTGKLIPDDLIDTAGTVSEAARALKRLGARRVYCCATHALLSGPAVERLRDAPIDEIAVANTIAVPESRRFEKLVVLSVGTLLAQAIANTHRDKSVSSLFD